MRVISVKALREFWERYPDAQEPLQAWYHDVKQATWRTPADIKRVYANASLLGDNRVVFNIKGNKYRVVIACNYAFGIVYVRFVGTHQHYDRIDAETV
jgi:mRNA interferase HigB